MHSTAGIILEYIREGTTLSFLLLAVALVISLICFCLYTYKNVPEAVAWVQLAIVLLICVYSLLVSIMCICCMNGYQPEGDEIKNCVRGTGRFLHAHSLCYFPYRKNNQKQLNVNKLGKMMLKPGNRDDKIQLSIKIL